MSIQYTVTGRMFAPLKPIMETNATTAGAVRGSGKQRAAKNTTEPALPAQSRVGSADGALGLLAAALEYVEDRHWEVALGTAVRREAGTWFCSCGNRHCPAIGVHPAEQDWQKRISGQPSKAREWWEADPGAAILLPTGRAFDVLDVGEQAGCLALARMERAGVPVGPVAATPTRRMYFFVLPNSRTKAVKLLTTLGWGRSRLDLAVRGPGDYVVAPPSRMGVRGQVQWVRQPGDANRWMPDVEELIAPIAYACGQAVLDK
ncbi:MAG TPA: bifunctional DNA primase/polymerase [Actinocrinis sp.]|jgi:hypothetical protein